MNFYIGTLNDSGSGIAYNSKEEFLQRISNIIDNAIANGDDFFDVQISSSSENSMEEI